MDAIETIRANVSSVVLSAIDDSDDDDDDDDDENEEEDGNASDRFPKIQFPFFEALKLCSNRTEEKGHTLYSCKK